MSVSLTLTAPLLLILAAATFSDLRARRIPNALSVGGAALGLLINAVTFGPAALALALLGWFVCLICFLPLYMSGGTAAGDVKLMAMVGAFLGPVNGLAACLLTLIAGAILAAVAVAWRRADPRGANVDLERAEPASASGARVALTRLDKIPYAAAIAIGGAAIALQPAWVTTILQ